MKIYVKKIIETKKIKRVICNKCGKDIKINEYRDFLNITKYWGYNSNYDNEIHQIDICQDCYKKFILSLKIKPKVITNRKLQKR